MPSLQTYGGGGDGGSGNGAGLTAVSEGAARPPPEAAKTKRNSVKGRVSHLWRAGFVRLWKNLLYTGRMNGGKQVAVHKGLQEAYA